MAAFLDGIFTYQHIH